MVMGRDFQNGLIKGAYKEAITEAGQTVTVKKFSGVTPGDPARGIQHTYNFTTICTKALISQLTQDDISRPGGLYQIGDLNVQIDIKLNEVADDPRFKGVGDRLVWENSEYRVLGKGNPIVISGQTQYYSYMMRKVDT